MPRPKTGYRLRDGTKVPGVTDILKRFMDQRGLIGWQIHRRKQGLPSYDETARLIGETAHAMVEMYLRGLPFGQINARLYALAGANDRAKAGAIFRKFQEWCDQYHFDVITQEQSLVSEIHRYGGTPEFVGMIADKRALFEIKTSDTIYPEHLIQMAAYEPLWCESHPDQPIDGGYHLLQLPRDGAEITHHYFKDLDVARELFFTYRKAWDLDCLLKTDGALIGSRAPASPSRRANLKDTVSIVEFLKRAALRPRAATL